MSIRNNLQDVLKKRGSHNATPSSSSSTLSVVSSAKVRTIHAPCFTTPTAVTTIQVNKFKPAAAPASSRMLSRGYLTCLIVLQVRNVPSLPSFSTPGFGKKGATPVASRPPPTPVTPVVSYIEKQSTSPGTKRSPSYNAQPVKRQKQQITDKENQRDITASPEPPTAQAKGKFKAATPDDDQPWLNLELDDGFNPNPFARLATDFPAYVLPVSSPKKTTRQELVRTDTFHPNSD